MLRALSTVVAIACCYTPLVESRDIPPRVLIFSKTEAFRDPSIPEAIVAVKTLGTMRGWKVDATEEAKRFTRANLSQYDAVVWLNTSGNVLNSEQQSAYEAFHRSGKGTVAVHRGGVDTEREGWLWYRKLASTTLGSKLTTDETTLFNFDPKHPAGSMLPWIWRHNDEWYRFSSAPSADIRVVLSVYDPIYYPELFHPISWFKEFDGGRYFYTGLGGTSEDYGAGSLFLSHLAGGIEWAAGKARHPVAKITDGDALILKEFDGVSPNGVWERQAPSPDFSYEVKPGALYMHDSSSASIHNRHLVRRGVAIDPKRPYAIEGKFSFPGPLDPHKPYSFCVNLNVAGDDGASSNVNTWSANVLLIGGRSQTQFMGFRNGVFTQIGMLKNNWGEADTEYSFRIYVNADIMGLPQHKMVSMWVKNGEKTLEEFQVDYSPFPYQPDYTKKVRFGLNSHGTNWTLKDLKIYYLDVISSSNY